MGEKKIMAITLTQLKKAEEDLFCLRKKYLEDHGWHYTCKTPGSTWLWRRIYMEDVYLCNMQMALSIEEAITDAATKTNHNR